MRTQWPLEKIIQAMQENMYVHMTYFAKDVSTVELVPNPDVTVVRSNINDDTFNYVLSARFTLNNAHERVKKVIELYSHPPLPFSWWVGPLDTPKNLPAILMAEGLSEKEEDVGMYLDLTEFKQLEGESDLRFEQVIDRKRLRDFADVIVSIGGSTEGYDKLYSKIPPHLYQKGAALEMHVGYIDQDPVITGILVLHADVAGIYYVATNPDYRNKGYGTAMMVHLIEKAKKLGYTISILQASREGKNLYERLGFKECCLFKEYARRG